MLVLDQPNIYFETVAWKMQKFDKKVHILFVDFRKVYYHRESLYTETIPFTPENTRLDWDERFTYGNKD